MSHILIQKLLLRSTVRRFLISVCAAMFKKKKTRRLFMHTVQVSGVKKVCLISHGRKSKSRRDSHATLTYTKYSGFCSYWEDNILNKLITWLIKTNNLLIFQTNIKSCIWLSAVKYPHCVRIADYEQANGCKPGTWFFTCIKNLPKMYRKKA